MIPKPDDIPSCARAYINAYKAEPWNEEYETSEIEKYISAYLNSDTKVCYALENEAVRMGCDSVVLGTQKDFPSHHFYLKNGFQEVQSVLLYKEII